jgi:serine/threonine-protein kinase ULK/ATG1
VVRAFDMEHKGEQLVAKIIEINSQSKIESLKMELKVLEAFQGEHQNLVGFKYYYLIKPRRLRLFSKKCYYIIMEYCNGGTLEEKIARSKKLSEIEIIDFLGQFCSGYRELLRQGIIHRGT